METRKVIKKDTITVTREVVEVHTTFYKIHIPDGIESVDVMIKDLKKLSKAIICKDYTGRLSLISTDKLFIMSIAEKWHVYMMEVYDRVREEVYYY